MSPSLEGMFNRDANLSVRRPLLAEPQKAVLVAPRAPPRDTGPQRPLPATRNLPYKNNDLGYQWKPSNVEIERRLREMQEKRIREKIGYFQDKIPTRESSLDRREAELIFKFDPHASAEYLASQQQQPRALASKPPSPPSPPTPPSPASAYSRIPPVPERDGPFVFGVHSPSQFPARRDHADYPDYPDYADVDDADKDNSTRLNCCDSVRELADKTKKRTKQLKYQIKDKGKFNKCGKKNKIKCVLVGDGAVGKSSLIAAYAQDTFREEYQPTAYDTFNVVVDVDDRSVCVEICDTAGQDNMSELRELCYPGTDVLMLCFSVVRPETFRSVADRWTKAVAKLNAPVILIGTQSDLAVDPRVVHNLRTRGEYVVTEAEAKSLASKINANYIETSAKTRKQLKDAFDAAILAGLPVIQAKTPLWKKLLCFS